MNILLSFLQDKGGEAHAIPAYRFWCYYLKNGIKEAGMRWLEVPEVDWAEGLVYKTNSGQLNKWSEITWSRTIEYIKNNRKNIDLFLCYLYPSQIDVSAIKQIQDMGIPCVNFYCDNIRHFEKVPENFKVFDLLWVPETEALPMYKKAKVKYINLPMPMWVAPGLREKIIPKEKPDITFIGSKDILREELFTYVISRGLDVNIQGSGWIEEENVFSNNFIPNSITSKIANQLSFIKEHSVKGLFIKILQKSKQPKINIPPGFIHEKPNFNDYIYLTQNSSVTLGINRVPSYKKLNSNPLKYSRLRDIEAPMLGACYLTEQCEGVDMLYDTENEINTYNSFDELIYKARELLHDDAKRVKLRHKGQKKALNEYSIPASLNKIKKIIF